MPITLFELIDKAAEAMGSQRALAAAMNKKPPRLSEWKSGEAKPDAHEIAFLARNAGLPVLETVAEIEAQLDSRYSEIWREALGKLRAAGIAASVAILIASNPAPADAKPATANKTLGTSLYIMSTNDRAREATWSWRLSHFGWSPACARSFQELWGGEPPGKPNPALAVKFPIRARRRSISHRASAIRSMRRLFRGRCE